jgi:hypothetical protein
MAIERYLYNFWLIIAGVEEEERGGVELHSPVTSRVKPVT